PPPMPPPLPILTLFPYTTLFRSALDGPGMRPVVPLSHLRSCRDRWSCPLLFKKSSPVCGPWGTCLLLFLHVFLRKPGADARYPLDRKSTRLNSSHVKISYAVFCL